MIEGVMNTGSYLKVSHAPIKIAIKEHKVMIVFKA
jgi:hypothetical protein